MQKAFDMQIKLLLIGDSGVGKSSVLLRYCNDSYSESFITTIGIDFKIKNIQLNSKQIKLQIWDTAGQERFRSNTTSYLRGAHGIILMYNITDRNTFTSIRDWVEQIQMHADINVNKILVGSKCDLEDERAISYEEGQAFASEYNIQFFEVSSKKDLNVEKMFLTISEDVKNRVTVDRSVDVGGPKILLQQIAERKRPSFFQFPTDFFEEHSLPVRISGTASWWNSNQIRGRYHPQVNYQQQIIDPVLGDVGRCYYRNIDTHNTTMVRIGNRWEVRKKEKVLAFLETESASANIFPHNTSKSRIWEERCGIIRSYFCPVPTMVC
jgi:Ras-related protein Rab-8A